MAGGGHARDVVRGSVALLVTIGDSAALRAAGSMANPPTRAVGPG